MLATPHRPAHACHGSRAIGTLDHRVSRAVPLAVEAATGAARDLRGGRIVNAALRRTAAMIAIATMAALGLAACSSQPATLDDLLAQLEASHEGLQASTFESSDDLVVSLDVQHVDGADAALADALVDEVDERIDAADLDMPDRWRYRIGFPPVDGRAPSVRLWSDVDPELRTAVLEVVPDAGCDAGGDDDRIHVTCTWLDATQAEGVRDAAALLTRLPTDLADVSLEAWADDRRTLVRTFEGVTDEHVALLDAAADVFAAEPQEQEQAIITFSSATSSYGSFDEDVRISVFDPDASLAPALQTLVDDSPLEVRVDLTDGSGMPVAELVDATP